MLKNYTYILSALNSDCWAIQPEKMDIILSVLNAKLIDEPREVAASRRATSFKNVKGDIGIIPLFGTITHRPSAFSSGGTSTESFGKTFDEAVNDNSIGTIILDVDSPGGSVSGVTELSSKIRSARGRKPIIACVNSLCASAAYWIASAADEIVGIPSSMTGSVGVLAVHTDYSKAEENAGIKTTIIKAGKHKAEGNSYEPLDEESMAAMQERVDHYYNMFTSDLAQNRGVTVAEVEKSFGQGRVFDPKSAIERGMIDRIGTLEQVINDLVPKNSGQARSNRAKLNQVKLTSLNI